MTKHWIGNAAMMVLCACVLTVAAWGQEFPVATKTLKNGMKVLVQTDHSIPNVALYIFYRVGARNEGPGTTGISHFFEHMMFNGAKKNGPGELDKVMEPNGGFLQTLTPKHQTFLPHVFTRPPPPSLPSHIRAPVLAP